MGDPYKAVRQLASEAQGLAVSKQGLIERFKILLDVEQEVVNDLDKRAAPFLEMAQDITLRLGAANTAMRDVRAVLQGVK